MAEEIMIDVCMAATDQERKKLIDFSVFYWEKKGFKLLNEDLGPDKITLVEGKIVAEDSALHYLPNTQYAKRKHDGAVALIFIKK